MNKSCTLYVCNYTIQAISELHKTSTTIQTIKKCFQMLFQQQDLGELQEDLLPLYLKYADSKVIFFLLPYFVILLFNTMVWAIVNDKKDNIKRNIIFLPDNIPHQNHSYFVTFHSGSTSTSHLVIQLEGTSGISEPHILQHHKWNVMGNGERTSFILNTANSLGDLKSVHMWLDFVGSVPSWYCEEIFILDIQTDQVWEFQINDWFSPCLGKSCQIYDANSFPNSCKLNLQLKMNHAIELLNEQHSWISIIKKHPSSFYTRYQRTSVCGLNFFILLSILVVYFSFQPYERLQLEHVYFSWKWSDIHAGILIALISFTVSSLVSLLFKIITPVHLMKTEANLSNRIQSICSSCFSTEMWESNIVRNTSNKLRETSKEMRALTEFELYDTIEKKQRMFRRFKELKYILPNHCKYVLNIIVTSTILVCSYISMLFGADFSWAVTFRFFVTFLIAILFNILILEFIKVALIILNNAFVTPQMSTVENVIDAAKVKEKILEVSKVALKACVRARMKNRKIYRPLSRRNLKTLKANCILQAYTKILMFDFGSSVIILFILSSSKSFIFDELCFYSNHYILQSEDYIGSLQRQSFVVNNKECFMENCMLISVNSSNTETKKAEIPNLLPSAGILTGTNIFQKSYPALPILGSAFCSILENCTSRDLLQTIRSHQDHTFFAFDFRYYIINRNSLILLSVVIDNCHLGICIAHTMIRNMKMCESTSLQAFLTTFCFACLIIVTLSVQNVKCFNFLHQNRFYKNVGIAINVSLLCSIATLIFLFIHYNIMATIFLENLVDVHNQTSAPVQTLTSVHSAIFYMWILIIFILWVKILYVLYSRLKSKSILFNTDFDVADALQFVFLYMIVFLGFLASVHIIFTSLSENFCRVGNTLSNLLMFLFTKFPVSDMLTTINKFRSPLLTFHIFFIVACKSFFLCIKCAFLIIILNYWSLTRYSIKLWLKRELQMRNRTYGKVVGSMSDRDYLYLIQALNGNTLSTKSAVRYVIQKKIKSKNDLLVYVYAILSVLLSDVERLKHNSSFLAETLIYQPYNVLLRCNRKRMKISLLKTSIRILLLETKLNSITFVRRHSE